LLFTTRLLGVSPQADTIDASVNVGAPKYLRFGQNEPEIVE
jgi:hypothetical protein